MDDNQLESLAIKEIIEEIERKKRTELESLKPKPKERKLRPNKRFLGRTIVSVLQHNKRQYAQEKHNSSKKLKELERHKPRSRSKDRKRLRDKSSYSHRNHDQQPQEPDLQHLNLLPHHEPMDLTMYFLSNINNLLSNIQNVPKTKKVKKKKKKKKAILTIDLTKKSKRTKKKKTKKKRKSREKKRHSHRKCRSSSSSSSCSSSSSSSLSTICDTSSESVDDKASTLEIDLT